MWTERAWFAKSLELERSGWDEALKALISGEAMHAHCIRIVSDLALVKPRLLEESNVSATGFIFLPAVPFQTILPNRFGRDNIELVSADKMLWVQAQHRILHFKGTSSHAFSLR